MEALPKGNLSRKEADSVAKMLYGPTASATRIRHPNRTARFVVGYVVKDMKESTQEVGKMNVVIAGNGPDYYSALVESIKNPVAKAHHEALRNVRKELNEKKSEVTQSEQGEAK